MGASSLQLWERSVCPSPSTGVRPFLSRARSGWTRGVISRGESPIRGLAALRCRCHRHLPRPHPVDGCGRGRPLERWPNWWRLALLRYPPAILPATSRRRVHRTRRCRSHLVREPRRQDVEGPPIFSDYLIVADQDIGGHSAAFAAAAAGAFTPPLAKIASISAAPKPSSRRMSGPSSPML